MPSGNNGTLSAAWKDVGVYCQLTDDITNQILRNPDANLKSAQDIIKNIYKRKLYVDIGACQLPEMNMVNITITMSRGL